MPLELRLFEFITSWTPWHNAQHEILYWMVLGPRTLKFRDIKILRFWVMGFQGFATYPNFKVLGFQGLETIRLLRSWVFRVSLHIEILRSWVSRVLRHITILRSRVSRVPRHKGRALDSRSIKVPDLGLSEPRISDLFGTLAQVCLQYLRLTFESVLAELCSILT